MRPSEGKMPGTPGPDPISTRRRRIAELARQSPQAAFTTLAHHIDIDWLKEAYRRTRKDGAAGVDGQTATDYAANLEGNLRSLLDRAKSGHYQAPPVRRVHIPKGTGPETRPIGIPTFEDKILQRAVVMVLESVYEQDFLDCSYGFRPGRSGHQALEALRQRLMEVRGGCVLEIDIRKFFDTMDHRHLHAILRRRVRDGVLLRLIGKWLNAGVMEDGRVTHPDSGSPQGGVISPILSNAYLHEALDTWFEQMVKPRLKGRAHLIRYADDAVLVFALESDARRVMEVLPKRFGKYGLTLHPEKTRLVPFQGIRPGAPPGAPRGTPWHVRLLGVHPLLGSDAQGDVDGEAQDGEGPLRPIPEVDSGVVPQAPSSIAPGAARRPDGEVARAFRVLRDHRQFAEPEPLSAPRETSLAQVAQSPLAQGLHPVGAIRRTGAALPAASGATESRPPGHVAKSWPE